VVLANSPAETTAGFPEKHAGQTLLPARLATGARAQLFSSSSALAASSHVIARTTTFQRASARMEKAVVLFPGVREGQEELQGALAQIAAAAMPLMDRQVITDGQVPAALQEVRLTQISKEASSETLGLRTAEAMAEPVKSEAVAAEGVLVGMVWFSRPPLTILAFPEAVAEEVAAADLEVRAGSKAALLSPSSFRIQPSTWLMLQMFLYLDPAGQVDAGGPAARAEVAEEEHRGKRASSGRLGKLPVQE